MTAPYEEILEGHRVLRPPPSARHEVICSRLHGWVSASLDRFNSAKLLERRARIEISPGNIVCPDLALTVVATGKLWLAAEIIGTEDHRIDTVAKKDLYELVKLPRLWMIDPRYDNVEVYHAGSYGLVLKEILAGRDVLLEKLLPEFQVGVSQLFAPEP